MPRDGSEPASDVQLSTVESCRSRLNEVWMLTDFVAGQCKQGLKDLDVKERDSDAKMAPQALLDRLHEIEERAERRALQAGDCSFVEVVRDALNGLVSPASSLTVAYTTLATGRFRKEGASRTDLALLAFPNLGHRAAWHQRMQTLVVVVALLCTGVAAWQSARVALGKALLQTLTELQTQQAQLAVEKVKLEAKATPPGDTSESYRLCDRPLVKYAAVVNKPLDEVVNSPRPRILPYESSEAGDACGRDDVLRAHLDTAHDDLRHFMQDWLGVMRLGRPVPAIGQSDHEDVELRVAPVLLVWGNLVLPILFATIGSAIFVLLDTFTKVRLSTLDPRDTFLGPLRLVLGIVVGACIGLLFSAAGPAAGPAPSTAATVISSLTLTASGVAFLVGFAVESVFTTLNGLIARVFSAEASAR